MTITKQTDAITKTVNETKRRRRRSRRRQSISYHHSRSWSDIDCESDKMTVTQTNKQIGSLNIHTQEVKTKNKPPKDTKIK